MDSVILTYVLCVVGSRQFQVARDCSLGEDAKPEFTGELFQPVPWSQTTKHGMLPV